MEDEDLLIGSQPPNKDYDDLFNELSTFSTTNYEGATPGVSVEGYGTELGKSKYDKDLIPGIQIDESDFYNSLSSFRADTQPTTHKLGSALGRLTNIIPEAIGSVASALDFEDYINSNDEVGNWLTDITEKWKQSTNEQLPIYRENPGQPLDFGDSGWWIENGSALVNSIGGFAIGGGAITKGLTGLSKLTKAKKIAQSIVGLNKAERLGQGTQVGLTATMLNQSEGILEAGQVYDDIYKVELDRLNAENPTLERTAEQIESNEAAARQKAADAASATINANRVNILLNISSANLFLKAPKLTRGLIKPEKFQKNILAGSVEGVQESAEEAINFISGEYGRAVGRDKEYGFKEIVKDLGRPEAHEAALLGFLGGIGQTTITKEGVNRIKKTTDPETGEKISIKDYNKNAYNTQKDIIDDNKQSATASNVKSFTNAFNNLSENLEIQNALKKAENDGDEVEIKKLKDLHLDNMAFHNFQNGTTESFIKLYEQLRDGEQKEDMPDNYKELASTAITKIKKLEGYYNDASKFSNHQEVYINKATRNDLENYITEVDTNINNISNDLNNSINKITKVFEEIGGTDKTTSEYFIDINNIDFNPAQTAKAKEEFATLQKIIKNNPEFKTLQDLKGSKDDLADALKQNLIDYNSITSDDYQDKYQDKLDNIRNTAENLIDKQVDTVEKEIKSDEKVQKEADRQENISTKNAETEQAVADRQQEVSDGKDNLNTLADRYNIGETTDLENIFGDNYKDVSGTITDIKEDSEGNRQITVLTEDGDIISTEDTVDPKFKNNDVQELYNVEGTPNNNTSNEDSINKSEKVDDKLDNSKDKNKLSDVKLLSTYRDSGKLLKGIPEAFLEYERNPVSKIGDKVYFEVNTDIDPTLIKSKDFKKAITLFNKFKVGDELAKEDKNFMVDYLPIKAKIDNSDTVYTFLTSKPSVSTELLKTKEKATDFNIKKGLILYSEGSPKGLQIKAFSTKGEGFKQTLKGILFIDLDTNKELWWNNTSRWDWKDMYISKESTNNDALEAYNNRTRPLRINLINHVKDGNNINSLFTTVKGQYGGQIQLDKKNTQNSILDLNDIDSLEDIELFVLDENGQLKDISNEHAKGWYKTKKNWKGSTYLKTKLANGNTFYLNLNFSKVNNRQANVVFEIYRSLLQKGNRPTTTVNNLDNSIQATIKKSLKKEIDLIKKIEGKPYNEIIISELLDLVFWDGSTSNKSKLRINYGDQRIEFGDTSYSLNEFTDDKRDEFVNWVTTNKNRNFKFKSKQSDISKGLNSTHPDYLQYAIDEKIINTNAKVNQPTFQGFTNLYLNNGISGGKLIEKAPVQEDFNRATDTNLKYASGVDGNNYYASADNGRVFLSKDIDNIGGRTPYIHEQAGGLITDTVLIGKIEASIRSNPFAGAPNITLKKYSENKPKKARISQENLVPLQENTLADENTTLENKPLVKKSSKKLSKKELKARAMAVKNNLNKKCK